MPTVTEYRLGLALLEELCCHESTWDLLSSETSSNTDIVSRPVHGMEPRNNISRRGGDITAPGITSAASSLPNIPQILNMLSAIVSRTAPRPCSDTDLAWCSAAAVLSHRRIWAAPGPAGGSEDSIPGTERSLTALQMPEGTVVGRCADHRIPKTVKSAAFISHASSVISATSAAWRMARRTAVRAFSRWLSEKPSYHDSGPSVFEGGRGHALAHAACHLACAILLAGPEPLPYGTSGPRVAPSPETHREEDAGLMGGGQGVTREEAREIRETLLGSGEGKAFEQLLLALLHWHPSGGHPVHGGAVPVMAAGGGAGSAQTTPAASATVHASMVSWWLMREIAAWGRHQHPRQATVSSSPISVNATFVSNSALCPPRTDNVTFREAQIASNQSITGLNGGSSGLDKIGRWSTAEVILRFIEWASRHHAVLPRCSGNVAGAARSQALLTLAR